jgi:hypothetical protein
LEEGLVEAGEVEAVEEMQQKRDEEEVVVEEM